MSSPVPSRSVLNQIFIFQPLAVHPLERLPQLLQRIQAPDVVAPCELVQVAVQMLVAHMVVDPHNAPLEDRSERFNRVRVHLVPNVLLFGMLDSLVRVVPLQPLVALVVIRLDGFAFLNVLPNESGERLVGFPAERTGDDLAPTLLGSHHGRLALRSPVARALGLPLVLLLAAYVGFVYFNFAGQLAFRSKHVHIVSPGLPDPVRKEPGGFLRYPEISVQFHTGYALDVRAHQVVSDCPYLIAEL